MEGSGADGFTAELASRAAGLRRDDLPDDVVELVRQCVLDWVGVTVAGAGEPAAALLADELVAGGGERGVTVVGRRERLPVLDAALVNGTASHALDYDDVNDALLGHPSVPILGALLALGEAVSAPGREVVCAFVAGYETECRVGRALGPSHYQRGFHATGTVGTLGAAAACARLLGLDPGRTATALGIAATSAAGLKSMFGTMCKPLHAGRAGAGGLLAARLAARGYSSAADAVEGTQGFAETHTASFDGDRGLAPPRRGWHLRDNLFKYHAACFQTHSAIEGLRRLRDEHAFALDDVAEVVVDADAGQLRMCAIPEPTTGLEAKFSLRHTAAMVLAGEDTSAIASFSDDAVGGAEIRRVRSLVTVRPDDRPGGPTPVIVRLGDGRILRAAHDMFVPEEDLDLQRRLLTGKFRGLVAPVLGQARCEQLLDGALDVDGLADLGSLLAPTRP